MTKKPKKDRTNKLRLDVNEIVHRVVLRLPGRRRGPYRPVNVATRTKTPRP